MILPFYYLKTISWCPWRESDPRPLPYQGSALPLSHMGVNYSTASANRSHLERATRLELATFSLENWSSTSWATPAHPSKPTPTGPTYCVLKTLVEGEGFEPSYSERTDLQSVAFNHSATPPNRTRDYADNLNCCQIYKRVFVLEFGAGCRNRTDDLRITSALLYQLS